MGRAHDAGLEKGAAGESSSPASPSVSVQDVILQAQRSAQGATGEASRSEFQPQPEEKHDADRDAPPPYSATPAPHHPSNPHPPPSQPLPEPPQQQRQRQQQQQQQQDAPLTATVPPTRTPSQLERGPAQGQFQAPPNPRVYRHRERTSRRPNVVDDCCGPCCRVMFLQTSVVVMVLSVVLLLAGPSQIEL